MAGAQITVSSPSVQVLLGSAIFGPIVATGFIEPVVLGPVLASGDNSISVPAGSIGFIFAPLPTNTAALTLKGASADTGLPIPRSSPSLHLFDATSRTDTATVTSGSDSVADSSIAAADQGKEVTGTGIPAGTYVGTVTPGTSFLLSSSQTSQVNVNATANGTAVTITPGSTPATIHINAAAAAGQSEIAFF